MPQQHFGKSYTGNPAENYERYFVPAIGAPLAKDLIQSAAIQPGERVLDVACGTGVVTRLAAEKVDDSGSVTGLDVNPGMVMVARKSSPPDAAIDWQEASAEAMPFEDASFDVVLCQMGLQFMPDKRAALSEMHRVLAPGGRVIFNVPGPTPPVQMVLAEALEKVFGTEAAAFVTLVFSLHDSDEIRGLLSEAGFTDLDVEAEAKSLHLPPPADFLWQYVHGTPLAAFVAKADEEQLESLERLVVDRLQNYVVKGSLILELRMVTATGRKM